MERFVVWSVTAVLAVLLGASPVGADVESVAGRARGSGSVRWASRYSEGLQGNATFAFRAIRRPGNNYGTFTADTNLGHFEGTGRNVAIYDLNGDAKCFYIIGRGRLDGVRHRFQAGGCDYPDQRDEVDLFISDDGINPIASGFGRVPNGSVRVQFDG